MERKNKFKVLWLVVVFVLIGLSFFGGVYAGYENRPEVSKITALYNKDKGQPESVDFEAFWKAWNLVNEKYIPANYAATTSTTSQVKVITEKDKVYGAIQGMLKSLDDPYTVFFKPEQAKTFQEDISGNFEGVGMEIGIRDDILTVVAPLKDTPAERAGIEAGDKILKIDNKTTVDMSVDAAIHLIRGKGGTVVRLSLLKEGANEPKEVSVTRGVIQIPTIKSIVKGDVFVISLYSFTAQSPDLFRNELQKFASSGNTKLVLDLRSNPGGYLDAAVDMASWFLPKNSVVVSENFGDKQAPSLHYSRGYNIFTNNLKMAILVNRGSASASEILAGALQDYGIAKLIGERTFGKGSVQELVNINDETQMKVTIARWLTAKGRSISVEGLHPDYEVKMTAEDVKKGKDPQLDKAIEILNR
ncbi:MAG: S41 family peptidase [Candidatus Vogelbacteria bacterium]|nr:S41 family peptidase [Candidatus Vogelbacteria bacterium]